MDRTTCFTQISYRPDIDGLRAVAIIAVVVFHAFPDFLLGGFVGVDVFFVISGYLIAGVILTRLSKGAIISSIINIPQWAHALFTEPTPLAAFRALDVPILYMLGARSPKSSRAVAQLLIPELPRVRVVEFNALGHMGPVTHPALVNEAIGSFLREHVAAR